eukprot:TRINITY_DN4949_c1_g1_i1.p3 TRINITY_DN4949_c1_g1~~TRINITY_DN4949_c1_g1_i1.p3  ORF type:complete len:104 (-),score=16.18 TRINITY_DN4949_c1_g1_i1:523-834(-)
MTGTYNKNCGGVHGHSASFHSTKCVSETVGRREVELDEVLLRSAKFLELQNTLNPQTKLQLEDMLTSLENMKKLETQFKARITKEKMQDGNLAVGPSQSVRNF